MKNTIFIISLILISCDSETIVSNNPLDLFDEVEKINYEDILISEKMIGRAASMEVICDSLLIVFDSQDKHLYDLFNINSGELICRFGRIGRGPGEFGVPTLLSKSPNKPRTVSIFDRRRFRFAEFSIDCVLRNPEYTPKIKVKTFNKKHSKVYPFKNDLFLGVGYFESRYAISNKQGKIVKSIGKYPFQEQLSDYAEEYISFVYQGKVVYHNDGDQFVFACRKSPNFEICKIDDSTITQTKVMNFGTPQFTPVPGSTTVDYSNDNIVGFLDVAVSKQYIYLLYSGKNKANHEDVNISNKILVFTWEGEPIRVYKTNINLNMIEIINDKILLGANGNLLPNIYRFKL